MLFAGLWKRATSGATSVAPRGGSGLGSSVAWQQLGLILVPAAWICVNMVPLAMVLSYTYLPHAHRLQSSVVRHAWRTHSVMLVVITAAMVQAAVMTYQQAHHHPLHGDHEPHTHAHMHAHHEPGQAPHGHHHSSGSH